AEDVWGFVKKQVETGRQAYIVYPVIEGAKDDQPELDFPMDGEPGELDAATRKRSAGPSTALRIANDATSPKGSKTAKTTSALKAKGKVMKAEKLLETKKVLRAATDMYEELRTGLLAGLRLGLLHGRLSADDREVTMRRFQRGDIDVLIATTVIE